MILESFLTIYQNIFLNPYIFIVIELQNSYFLASVAKNVAKSFD